MHEWLSGLERKTNTKEGESSDWTPMRIKKLKRINNPVSRDVDYWIHNILEGYVTEFSIDTLKSFNEVEKEFFKSILVHFTKGKKVIVKCKNKNGSEVYPILIRYVVFNSKTIFL